MSGYLGRTMTAKPNPAHALGPWYLATPYTKYPDGLGAAHHLACWQTSLLVRAGVSVFSPIAHSHMVAMIGGIDPRNHDVWLPICAPFMTLCRGIIVLQADGWRQSYGMAHETAEFARMGKPQIDMLPGVVPEGLV